MDFHNLAARQTSALIAELLGTQSGAALQQLQAVREALDATARALAPPMHLDEDVRGLADRLAAAANADVQRVREEGETALNAAGRELQAVQAVREKLSSALASAEAETAILRSELQTSQQRAADGEQRLSASVAANADLESRLRRLDDDLEQAQQMRASLDAHLAEAHDTVQHLLVEIEQLRARLDRQTLEHAATAGELAQARDAYRLRDEALGDLDASRARVELLEDELSQARQNARREVDELKAELRRTIHSNAERVQTLERELVRADDVRRERDAVLADLDARNARVEILEQELAAATAERSERSELLAKLDARAAQLQLLEAELSQARDLAIDRDRIAADLAAARGRAESLEQELAQSARELAASREVAVPPAAPAAAPGELVEQLRGEIDRMASLFDASARAVGEMASASNSVELLTDLVKRLSLQFSRVALFRLKGNRLEGEQQIGLDEAAEMSKLVIPTSTDSMLTRALNGRTVLSLYGDDVSVESGMPFTGAPTSAVALPIVVQGTPLGVVYADDADMPEAARGRAVHESSVGFARLLVGQVVVLLVRHMHELKMLAELSQYAATLIDEAKKMYEADTLAGRSGEAVRARLKDNIDCASQLYAYRAAMEGTAAAALLDEQILAELQATTAFSRDLASVIGQMAESDLQITAEAS